MRRVWQSVFLTRGVGTYRGSELLVSDPSGGANPSQEATGLSVIERRLSNECHTGMV